MMRLFTAINFNNETRFELLALRDRLQLNSSRGNFSTPENLHLTLVFLGECDAKQITAVKNAMDNVKFAPFKIEIDRVGRFRQNGGDIWWAGINADKHLIDLQYDLADKFANVGFTLDTRKYSPHITLGREVVTDSVPWQLTPFGENVTSIELMKSERVNGKLKYTAIHVKKALF